MFHTDTNMSSFGPILEEIGEFGLFQKRLVAALFIPGLFAAFDMMGEVFTGMNFPHRCNTDWILNQGPNLTDERQRNLTICVNTNGKYESCEMFTPEVLDLEMIEAYWINTTTGCINGLDYDAPKGASSIVTEFDLVFHRSSYLDISHSIYMAGVLVGSFALWQVADRCCRRLVVLLSLLQLLLCGVTAAFSPNFYVYTVLKFLGGISVAGILTTAVLGAEWSETSKFALCKITCLSSFSLGLMMMSGIAYFIRDWRILQLVLFSPLVLVVGILYWILPESARWLITQGRKKEAIKEIRRAAKVNGRKVPEDLLERLEVVGASNRGTMLDIFRISYLRKRALVMNFVWFGTSLMYYGLSLNVGYFGLDIYLTQFIFGVVEIPAHLGSLALIQRLGRRICQAGALVLGGAACLGIVAIPKDLPIVVTVIAVLGKFGATASNTIGFLYSNELYPTVMRQNGVGLNCMCARVAGVIAPLVRLLDVYHYTIPMLIYGIIPIAAGGFCLLLPETCDAELEDHVELREPENEKTTTAN